MWLVTISIELATFYRALIDDPLPCLARAFQIAETRLLVELMFKFMYRVVGFIAS